MPLYDKILNASYDNFLQCWKEQTEEDQHAARVEIDHRHLHLKIKYKQLELYEGRNNEKHIESSVLDINGNKVELFGIAGIFSTSDRPSNEHYIYVQEGMLEIKGFNHFENPIPYTFKACRFFAGWIMNLLPDTEEEYNRIDHLKIHDQGGLSELIFEDEVYTVELTQLEFAHTIQVFKLAFYDLPLAEVDINSRAFAYTWVNPEATRIGMNLRYLQSGWTLMEEGYINSGNLEQA